MYFLRYHIFFIEHKYFFIEYKYTFLNRNIFFKYQRFFIEYKYIFIEYKNTFLLQISKHNCSCEYFVFQKVLSLLLLNMTTWTFSSSGFSLAYLPWETPQGTNKKLLQSITKNFPDALTRSMKS